MYTQCYSAISHTVRALNICLVNLDCALDITLTPGLYLTYLNFGILELKFDLSLMTLNWACYFFVC